MRKRSIRPTLEQWKEKLNCVCNSMKRQCAIRNVVEDTTTEARMPAQSCGPMIHPKPHSPCRSTFNPDRGMANMLELTQRNHLADCGVIIVQRHLKEPCETCRSCFWERSTTTTARGCWRATRMQSHKRVGSNNRLTRHWGNCWSSRTERIGWFRWSRRVRCRIDSI